MVLQHVQYNTVLCTVLALIQIWFMFSFQLTMYCNVVVYIVPWGLTILKGNSILPSPNFPECKYCTYRDGIHESTISLSFLGIILRFPRLEVSTFAVMPYYKMLFMNKLKFHSLMDGFVWISETIWMAWFSVRFFSPFDVFIIDVSLGKNVFTSK